MNNGGSLISRYELWVDNGDDFTSDFSLVYGYYDGSKLIYDASENDGLVIGKTYRFISRSVNEIGYSEFSIASYIAFGDVPEAPGAPIRVESTKNTIKVQWTSPV